MRHFLPYIKILAGLPVLLGCLCKRVTRSFFRTFFKIYLLPQFLSYRAQNFKACSLIYCLQIAVPVFWYFVCNHFYESKCTHMFKNRKFLNIFQFWTSIKIVTDKISKNWYYNLKIIYQRSCLEILCPVAQKLWDEIDF